MTEIALKRVNRREQIEDVRTMLNRIRLGRTIFESVLEWYGIPGIGKTTLGRMIADVCMANQVPFGRVDFSPKENPRAEQYHDDPIQILEDLFIGLGVEEPVAFRQALEQYRQTDPKNILRYTSRQKQAVKQFVDYLNDLLERGPIILLFDTTDQASTKTAAWLEEHVISPLARTGKSLIIWTGRHRRTWERFEVRRRVVSQKLPPLPPEATVEHVGTIGDRIYRLTRGHPLGNEQVAEAIQRYQARGQEATEDELLRILIDRVIDRYVMKGIDSDLNAAIRILAAVRQFDAAFLQRLLSKLAPQFEHLQLDDNLALDVLSRLAGTYLVEWDRVRKGYTIDPTLRRILALHLRYDQPEQYMNVNQEAITIYTDWIKRVRENPSIYVVERLYHQACIALAGGKDKKEVAASIGEQLRTDLQSYYWTDRVDLVQKSSTEQLRQELQGDEELQEMLGTAFGKLIQLVSEHQDIQS